MYDLKEDIKARPRLSSILAADTEHERPFRPSHPPKKGIHNYTTLGKFPNYMENPPMETVRIKPDENAEERPRFKMTTNSFTRPTPSIVTNMKNLKTSFPSVFARRTS